MTTISNLPQDLVEEILSRVPLTSLRRIRSTCKKWNVLSKNGTFTTKHLTLAAAREDEFLAIVKINKSLYLMSINLQRGIHNNDFDPSIRPSGQLISLHDTDKLDITGVYHCEGLLLCTIKDYTRIVICNPYSGQTRWICAEPNYFDHCNVYAFGYEEGKSCRTYKILRFCLHPGRSVYEMYDVRCTMYDANSNSWRVPDVNPGCIINNPSYGVSLKGNTYWVAGDNKTQRNFLLCFDFTTESFGQRLPLPYDQNNYDRIGILSSVREEQLAVLVQHWEMEVWVTTKIEPNAVSWTKFLAVDMVPLIGCGFSIYASFLVIDEEKRSVVVFDKDKNLSENRAYFIGGNGYFREVDLGDIGSSLFFPQALSYVPSSVQINHLA